MAVLGRGGRFLRVNDAWTGALGYSAEELLGRSYLELVHPDDAGSAEATTERLVSERGSALLENRVRAKDGSWHWVSWSLRSEEDRIYAAAREVNERKQLETERELLLETVQAMAHTDQLTGLPNRRAWDDELRRELARARRNDASLAVAMIDVDHFKQFNDTHGHQAGDDSCGRPRSHGGCASGSPTSSPATAARSFASSSWTVARA